MGLHDSNATIRGQILMMSPLPSVSQAYAFVKQDKKARQGYQDILAPFANALARNSVNAATLTIGSGFKKATVSNSGSARPVLKCTYCNFNGHTKENCYKLIGYPANWKKKKKEITGSAGSVPINTGQLRVLPKENQANAAASVSNVPFSDQFTHMQ